MFRCIEFCASRLRDVATYQRERCKVANGTSLRAFGCYCGMVDCQVFACTAVSRYAVHAAFGVYGAVVYGKVGFNGIESAVVQALCVECAAPRDDQSFPESDGSFLCFQVIDANEPYCQPLDFGIDAVSLFNVYHGILQCENLGCGVVFHGSADAFDYGKVVAIVGSNLYVSYFQQFFCLCLCRRRQCEQCNEQCGCGCVHAFCQVNPHSCSCLPASTLSEQHRFGGVGVW